MSSDCFQIAGRKLAALSDDVEADALTLGQSAHACLLHCADVYEHVFCPAFRLDEFKSLGAIEKLLEVEGLLPDVAERQTRT